MTTEKDTTYNGWTNYETWLANVHATNGEGWEDEIRELITEARRTAAGDPNPYMSADDNARYAFTQALKEHHENWVFGEDDTPAGFRSDLLRAAFDEINFNELARHYWDDEETNSEPDPESDYSGSWRNSQ